MLSSAEWFCIGLVSGSLITILYYYLVKFKKIEKLEEVQDPTEEKYPEGAIKYLDEHFPKGNKLRGEAMVLLSLSYLAGKKENEPGTT